MKISYFYLLFFSLLLTFSSCQDKDDQEADFSKIREIGYNYLNEATQETIIGDWRKAVVRKMGNGNYELLFNTNQDALLGPILLEIDGETRTVIKMYPRN
ncbi:hypothetical protein JYB64_07970 [Algoriphagus aestuarii]|nr:hypothetical protein [Algoriphagus aestuarii]